MKPVTQTIFWDPDAPPEKQRGNCLTAVVASLLELPIDQVPDFVQDHVDHYGDHESSGDHEWNWWHALLRFVKSQGYRLEYLAGRPEQVARRAPAPGEFYTASGQSPRDPAIHHIVIYRDGVMVWDPHPDRTGLVTVDLDWLWTLVPLESDGGDA